MVACTTTGTLWDSFIERPGQSSTYYRYGPWHCHVSAPHWGHCMDWRSYQKKKETAIFGTFVRIISAVMSYPIFSPVCALSCPVHFQRTLWGSVSVPGIFFLPLPTVACFSPHLAK